MADTVLVIPVIWNHRACILATTNCVNDLETVDFAILVVSLYGILDLYIWYLAEEFNTEFFSCWELSTNLTILLTSTILMRIFFWCSPIWILYVFHSDLWKVLKYYLFYGFTAPAIAMIFIFWSWSAHSVASVRAANTSWAKRSAWNPFIQPVD